MFGFSAKKPTPAMQYGIDNETRAKSDYFTKITESYKEATLRECGIWKNPQYPTLSCSPDGLGQLSPGTKFILLEVKCLTKTNINPNRFEDELTDKQIAAFYLIREEPANNPSILLPNSDEFG